VLSFALTLAGLIGAGTDTVAASTLGPKLYFDACPRFGPDVEFNCYRDFAEVQQFLRDAAEAHPELATLESIGKSFQGRDLWVLTITDRSGGAPEDKPAIWVDGGIDADEVVAIETALGLIHRLLTDNSDEIADLLKRRTFYIAPAVIPDSSELQMRSIERPRDTTLRPWDDDGDGQLDEDGPEDLDGDQQALTMRQVNPNGAWTASDEDPRLMRRRRPDDQGPFYDQWLEGIDNDDDGEYQEDRLGGVDPNRNYPGNWDISQRGNGPFAGSEIEIRAQMDFIEAHPNIAASQHLHSSGGVVLRPPSVPDWKLPASDEELYMRLSERGLEVTGYNLATTVYDWNWPRGSSNKKGSQVWRDKEGDIQGGPSRLDGYAAYGGSIDSLYKVFGVVAFANEIYQMGEDDDGDGRIEGHERLRWDDEELGGVVFKEWEPFEHPQLGEVEIGGWRKFGANNPLADDLPEEVRRNVEFVLMQARNTPQLEISALEIEPVGGHHISRVKATVANNGFAPTELAIRTSHGRAVPVRVEIKLDNGAELLSSEAELELGTLSGHEEKEVEWLVHHGPGGGVVQVAAWHPKGGGASKSVELASMDDERHGAGGER
jgi:hypothetical protein